MALLTISGDPASRWEDVAHATAQLLRFELVTEARLAHPVSLAEAQSAHREAGARVRRLAEQYGLATVLTWVHSGLPAAVLARAQVWTQVGARQ